MRRLIDLWIPLLGTLWMSAMVVAQDEILEDFRQAFPRFEDPAERVEAVQTLESATSPEVLRTLRTLFRDRDPEVARAAIVVLGRLREEPIAARHVELLQNEKDALVIACLTEAAGLARRRAAVPALIHHLGSRDWFVRLKACEALGRLRDEAAVEPLLALVEDREVAVRVAALDALGAFGDQRAAPAVIAALSDRAWQVRAAAIACAAGVRAKASIPVLIGMLRSEDGRLAVDAQQALEAITGDHYDRVEVWERWWKAFGERYEVPSLAELKRREAKRLENAALYGPVGGKKTTYHGVQTTSKRVLFILDVSGSMEDLVIEHEKFEGRGYKSFEKMEIVKTELIRTIDSLESHVRFNILVFATQVKSWKKGLVPANVVTRSNAKRFVERLRPVGGAQAAASSTDGGSGLVLGRTNTYGVLMKALQAENQELRDRNYKLELDTIFFLSDGRPTTGLYVETEQIIERVSEANRSRRVVIHTIAIGQFQKAFMERLARGNGGVYVDLGK